MSLIYLILNIFFLFFYLNFLKQKINIEETYKEYIDSMKNLKGRDYSSNLVNSLDNLTIKGSRLLMMIVLYLMPSIPIFYFLKYLRFSPFISLIIISTCYLFFFIKYKNG